MTDNATLGVLADGVAQTHTICPAGDQDWMKFQLANPASITLETSGPTPLPGDDTVMGLYDSNKTLIEQNDDKGLNTNYSYIQRCGTQPLPAGTYYVKVEEFGNDGEIPSYNIVFRTNTGCIPNTNISIAGTIKGSYWVAPGTRITPQYSMANGPVQVVNTDVSRFLTSERVHNGNGFVNELMGVPDNQLTNEYWFPWYDNLGMQSWILLGNPSTSSPAHVHVSIAGIEMPGSPYTIGAGTVLAKQYALMDGPVHITSDLNVFTSERVATGQGFVQETPGVPNNQLTKEYWFPWYDNLGMMSWILVGNPSTTNTAHVTINIAGTDYGPYDVGPGGRITPRFPIMNGPVHVTSDINVFTSERVHGINGFVQETMGYPNNQLTKEYWFPWYDNLGMISWILVGNPSTSATANVHIYIAGTEMPGSPYTIGPGGRITPQFGVMNGPVHVVSDINVFTSERVHTGQGFVQETMGYSNNQLVAKYWFPWYDNVTMTSWVLVGRP